VTTITEDYRALNAELHRTRPDYGRRGHRHADRVVRLVVRFDAASVLDFGCGKGTLAPALRARLPKIDVREYDPAIPGKDANPEPADILVCCDVLEHIEPDCLDDVLAELARLTLKVGHLVIATQPDQTKLLPDGRNPHLIVQPASWWRERLRPYFRVRQDDKSAKNVTFTVFKR
jgi:2-polyprenyl-3-methyl-5-hydroxy-6-metoxy-1,4-benzoquinol methylase